MYSDTLKKCVNKNARVCIIADQDEQRANMVQALMDLGFTNVTALGPDEELRSHLDPIRFDWIVTTMMTKTSFNTLQLLDFLNKNKEHRHIRVSAFITPNETDLIPKAFEKGLLSWHQNQFSVKAIVRIMGEFLEQIPKISMNDIRVASHYLRKFLKENRKYYSLMALEEKLIELFPGEPDLLLELAKANIDAGHLDSAKTLLTQATFLDQNLARECQKLNSEIKAKKDRYTIKRAQPSLDAFGLKSCVIVEPDETVSTKIASMLKDLGMTQVNCFTDGESAWAWLAKNPEPDLILQEWRIAKLGGIAFIQRIRSHGFKRTLIIVISSLVKKEDLPLLNEMSIVNVITKPFGKREFYLALRWALIQHLRPSEQKVLEAKIISHLACNEMDLARRLKVIYFADKRISAGRKALVSARFAYHEKNYNDAKDKVIAAIHLTGAEPLDAVNMLGKCLLKLGDERNALKCFEKAQSISPQNIKRLCDMAEIHLVTGKNNAAVDTISRAEKIDNKNADYLMSGVKIAASTNNIQMAKKLIDQVGSKMEFVTYMNNRAIALTISGKREDAFTLYRRALETLPQSETNLRSILTYNLGLAYVRGNDLVLAKEALEESIQLGSLLVLRRAQSLMTRVQRGIARGEAVELTEDLPESKHVDFDQFIAQERQQFELSDMYSTQAKPGEVCLHLIFFYQPQDEEKAA